MSCPLSVIAAPATNSYNWSFIYRDLDTSTVAGGRAFLNRLGQGFQFGSLFVIQIGYGDQAGCAVELAAP
jgi:hypothetical protein